MSFTEWLERPSQRPTVVLRRGERPARRWADPLPLIVVTSVAMLILMLACVLFWRARITPVHVAMGRPALIRGVRYRVVAVRYVKGRVLVTLRARADAPLTNCPGIAAFQLEDGGNTIYEKTRYFDAASKRWRVTDDDGCFPDPEAVHQATVIPPSVRGALDGDIIRTYERQIRHTQNSDAIRELRAEEALVLVARDGLTDHPADALAETVPAIVQHVWSFWWRPQPPPFSRDWTITYRARRLQGASLVMRASDGFHLFGWDRFAVMALSS